MKAASPPSSSQMRFYHLILKTHKPVKQTKPNASTKKQDLEKGVESRVKFWFIRPQNSFHQNEDDVNGAVFPAHFYLCKESFLARITQEKLTDYLLMK
jgi:hypothetical protein